MEPVSILGTISAVVGIADVVTRSIKRLSNLKTKFRNAPFLISTLIGQLCTVQAALDQLSAWADKHLSSNPRYEQLALQVGSSLDCFRPLMMSLQDRLDQLEGGEEDHLGLAKRVLFVWTEQNLAEYCTILDRQVNALNLLLQAIQCKTLTEQSALLDDHESQVVLELAKECPSSVSDPSDPRVDDTTSLYSDSTRALSTAFDFDAVLMASRSYQTAHRYHLRQLVDSQREMKNIRNEQSKTKHHQNSLWNHFRPRSSHPAATNSWRKGLLESSNITRQDTDQGLSTIRSINSSEDGSGRTTFVKALRSSQDQGSFGLDERRIWKDVVRSTIEADMIRTLKKMEEMNKPLGNGRNKRHKEALLSHPMSTRLNHTDAFRTKEITAIEALWNDSGVQSYREQHHDRDPYDNLPYFANNMKRLRSSDFLPNNEDILRCYPQHVGFTSTRFHYREAGSTVSHAAEVRSEQEKWAFCLDHVASVAFAVDLPGPTENTNDPNPGEMSRQLGLFKYIANSKHLENSNLVLVFTRIDESSQEWRNDSLQQSSSDCSDDFHDGTDSSAYWSQLEQKFLDLVPEHFLSKGHLKILHADLVDPNVSLVQQIFENAHGVPNR